MLNSALVLLVSFFLCLQQINAQEAVRYSSEAESIFLEGLQRFKLNDFAGANEDFEKVVTQYPSSQRTSAAYLMAAKSLLQLRRYDESIQLVRDFLTLKSGTRYLADAHFTLGEGFYLSGRYEPAAGEFVRVLESTTEKDLVDKAEPLLQITCDEHLKAESIDRVYQAAVSPQVKFLLALPLSEKYIAAGKADQARTLLAPLIKQYPSMVYTARAIELLKKLEKRAIVKIGAVLPLFLDSKEPSVREIGAEMLQGIEYAIEESRANSGIWVDLKYLDSEGDPAKATDAVQALSRDNEVVAILGPVYSGEVTASASSANESGIPLITPTANANGLSSVGPYIFQANPDYDLRGRAAARYAMQQLGLRMFALLAPSDSYGKLMAESFAAEVARLGGKIIATEWYLRGATDLQEQFMDLRKAARTEFAEPVVSFAGDVDPGEVEKLSRAGVARELLDSLLASKAKVGVSALLGSRGSHIADSLGIPTSKEVPEPDTLENAITIIDGIYLPIASPEEIGILSSQLAYYNFKTQILGTGDWYNLVELDANRRYTSGVIFESDTYVDATDSAYLKFFDGFYQKTNTHPTKNTLFGYDTAKLLLSVISSGVSSRESIATSLHGVRDFRGLHSLISFNERRVNSALNILRYKGGEVKKLADIVVGDER
jgi:ABC-type branched-subunit amino acid transport system substrate-binding protein